MIVTNSIESNIFCHSLKSIEKVLKKYREFMGRRVGLGDILWWLDKTFAIIGPLAALLRALVFLLEHESIETRKIFKHKAIQIFCHHTTTSSTLKSPCLPSWTLKYRNSKNIQIYSNTNLLPSKDHHFSWPCTLFVPKDLGKFSRMKGILIVAAGLILPCFSSRTIQLCTALAQKLQTKLNFSLEKSNI